MSRSDVCTEEEISRMVHEFYAKVRRDAMLGPIFDGYVRDWDEHLSILVDFWSALLRGTQRFSGAPAPAHAALPGLTAGLFERWLALFHETTAALPNRAMAKLADDMAQRMAQSLWQTYQLQRNPEAPTSRLPL